MRSILNVEFATISGYRPLRLDLHLPDEANGPMPVVLWVHGGGYNGGDKDARRALSLIDKGIAVAGVEYRLSSEAKMPTPIHDVKGAVRWLRGHAAEYQFDRAHVGIWGTSAGGHLAALVATTDTVAELEGDVGGNLEQSSRVQAAVIWAGPSDATLIEGEPRRVFELALGRPIEEASSMVALLNPCAHANGNAAPTLAVHSWRDPQVPFRSSELLVEALHRAGAEATLQAVDSDVHGGQLVTVPGIAERSGDFLVGHLAAVAMSRSV